MQTYAGPALAGHVINRQIDAFYKVANGEMLIERDNADQFVPHGEFFRTPTKGTIDALQRRSDFNSLSTEWPGRSCS